MRRALVLAALLLPTLLVLACERDAAEGTGIGADRALERAPGGGVVHLVRVARSAEGPRFEPATLEIEPGDAVRIVQTWSIPIGIGVEPGAAGPAREFVERAGIRRSPLLVDPGDHVDLSFEDAPPGDYRYLGLGYEDQGMEGRIRVVGEEG